MNGCDALDASVVDALQSANPEFEVGIDGVFHEHRNVYAFKGIGKFLHGEGIGRGASTYPKNVDVVLKRRIHMGSSGDFCGSEQPVFVLGLLQPAKAFFAYTFEATGFRAGLPNAGTHDLYAVGCKFAGGIHDLLFGFGRARASNDYGTLFGVNAGNVERSKV